MREHNEGDVDDAVLESIFDEVDLVEKDLDYCDEYTHDDYYMDVVILVQYISR